MDGIIKRTIYGTISDTLNYAYDLLVLKQKENGLAGEDPALVMFSLEEIADLFQDIKDKSKKGLNI